MDKSTLQPQSVFKCFAQVNQIPRPSKHEEKMIEFLLDFGKNLRLDTRRDDAGNVIIRKPATPGMENRETIVLQSHMDMVCEKNRDLEFDFSKDAIQTYVDGEWMKAKGTTLGADDGIGVAMEMALLESKDIEHGPLECVFTRDEETGLTGAEGMKSDFMTGRLLVNLDSEDEGEIFVSCAGGCRTFAQFAYKEEPLPAGFFTFSLAIKGLIGGHSGDDIDKKRANANKLLARFLYLSQQKYDLRLIDIQAGGLHNAIPREAWCLTAVPLKDKESIAVDWNLFQADVEEEYSVTEKTMTFLLESEDTATSAINKDCSQRLIKALQAVDNGVFAVCQDLDLIETSSNLASIHKTPTTIDVNSSQRSSIHSARVNMANTFAAAFELAGAKVEIGEGYPGWKMNPNSEILRVAVEQYKKLFGKEPVVRGIHAGLECGLFSEKFPGMDMISMGPTLRGVHSPDEKLLIPTVQMVWDHLLAILKNAPTL
ncbi:MAG: aminoacyl-histidine dipeptidase [Bacteroidaceae bacterium]|nr:aminoacyl-histidine dipeptidase [Bacteroidaceae bacterium]MBQ9170804.1 aminoacyl-histidine dipeptidase [Bacteroidaceae bacterium]